MRDLSVSLREDFMRNRPLLVELIKRSYKEQNKGSYLGVLWNYIQPLAFIAVLYFVITRGFRTKLDVETSFGVYLVCGMVCWLYFSKGVTELSGVFRSYAYLIKKVDFDLRYLIVVKLVGALPAHILMILFAFLVASNAGYSFSIYALQIVYYIFSVLCLLFGIGLLTASISVFVRDVNNIVSLVVQFGFWLTPIFWSFDSLSSESAAVLRLSPIAYLVEGYRDSIYDNTWFWEKPTESLIFWFWCLVFVGGALIVFRKLRLHIAEVI